MNFISKEYKDRSRYSQIDFILQCKLNANILGEQSY